MNNTFLNACKGNGCEHTPIWIMRQAGRYLPQYQKVRGTVDFLTLCKTPHLAAEVTIQPVDILGVDAAILFSDILIIAEAMGLGLSFHEEKGPVFSKTVRTLEAARALSIIDPLEDVPFVLETIKILKKELSNKVPLIGFAGAPFTVATYIIEGGTSKNFINTKTIMYSDSGVFNTIMQKLTDSTIKYLSAQIDAGADAVQLFDSWAGVLSPNDFATYALPYVVTVLEEIKKKGVPVIYFLNNCAGLLEKMSEIKADVFGIDWRVDMARVVSIFNGKAVLQGNLDPCLLFSDTVKIKKEAYDILKKAALTKGHIFNLGHGVLPQTPVDNVKALVDIVHQYG
ncbi:MAG: uroporphyrinogen decarboxylase [Candidatus Magnetoovum sp. WYHC-5]|nr:uroporphyrinogen decarboxylase [Candidatus Magnetoovum sp. WYHC-5]